MLSNEMGFEDRLTVIFGDLVFIGHLATAGQVDRLHDYLHRMVEDHFARKTKSGEVKKAYSAYLRALSENLPRCETHLRKTTYDRLVDEYKKVSVGATAVMLAGAISKHDKA